MRFYNRLVNTVMAAAASHRSILIEKWRKMSINPVSVNRHSARMKQRHTLASETVVLVALLLASLAHALLAPPSAIAAPAIVDARASAPPALLEAQVEGHADGSRVLFDVNAPVGFDIIALTDPYRIVLELDELQWRPERRELAFGDAIVSRVRYGLFRPGTSRIVIDCERPAVVDGAYFIEVSSGRYRLVVDLSEVSHTAFLQTVKTLPLIANRATVLPYLARTPGVEDAAMLAESKASSDAALPPEAALFIQKAAASPPRPPALQLAALPFAPPPRKPSAIPDKRIIVVDPGHGGSDPGAISASGVYEKTITLKAARLVQEELRRAGRYNVLLTRNGDESIRLRDRVAFARAVNADLFISLHADANPNKSLRGASVYTLSEKASDAEAAALAERENKADLIIGVDLSREAPEVANILIDLAQRETMNQSARLAKLLVQQLGKRTALVRNTHRFADFAVLTAPDVPAVLIEAGHLSNPQDAKLLQQESYLRALAVAIAETVNAYFAAEQARRQ